MAKDCPCCGGQIGPNDVACSYCGTAVERDDQVDINQQFYQTSNGATQVIQNIYVTNNPGSTKVMLGTDDGVTTWYNIGADEGMTYFYTPNWNSYVGEYGDEMMKAANQEFLYRQKLAGKQFYFSHDPMVTLTQYPNSSFAMELNWLKETYGLSELTAVNFVKSGAYWIFVP